MTNKKTRKKSKNTDLYVVNNVSKIKKAQCQGAIQKNERPQYTKPELAELYDVICVIKGYKPVANISVSNKALNYYHKNVKKLANIIFRTAKKHKIKVMVNSIPNTNIRRATFFPKKYKKRAQLLHYITVTKRGINLRNDYIFGKLLGYPENNIKYFYKTKQNLNKYYQDKDNAKDLVEFIIDSDHYNNFIKHLKPFYFKPL